MREQEVEKTVEVLVSALVCVCVCVHIFGVLVMKFEISVRLAPNSTEEPFIEQYLKFTVCVLRVSELCFVFIFTPYDVGFISSDAALCLIFLLSRRSSDCNLFIWVFDVFKN